MSQAEKNPNPKSFLFPKNNQILFPAMISILVVLVAYVWFVSFGSWVNWHDTTDYYDQLATAFSHGSLALEKTVNPDLLSLPNPYNPNKRDGIDFPLDFSLYKGKYYLYFGPVPALLLTTFKFLGFGQIGDQYITFLFIFGIFILQSLLIVKIWKLFFHNIPVWLLVPCIILSGLISPLTWMLTEARIYEAAGSSAQFFFLAGLYFAIMAVTQENISAKQLLIGSILWALALGSRITQAVPVGFVVVMLTFLIARAYLKTKSLSKTIYPIAAMGLPLAIGLGLLGWYNWIRFGSVFETGFSYELTSSYLQKYSQVLFSPLYILPNLYDYLVALPRYHSTFPFLEPIRGRGDQIFSFIDLPGVYYTRAATGILISTPFILFAAIAIISILSVKRNENAGTKPDNDTFLFRWVIITLLGSFLFGFGVIVSYFWVVTRFLIDCTPSLIVLSVVGFWSGYQFLSQRFILRRLYTVAGLGLMAVSIVISNLLVLSIRASMYQALNPVLWNQLNILFAR